MLAFSNSLIELAFCSCLAGCANPTNKILVRMNVGDVLLFQGDVVHAGAGYIVEHCIHAYIDSPVRRQSRCLACLVCLVCLLCLPCLQPFALCTGTHLQAAEGGSRAKQLDVCEV